MKKWFMYTFYKKMYLMHDGMTAGDCRHYWVDIRTLKLGHISPWGNTYYAYSKPNRDVTHPEPGQWVNPMYAAAHNRWILSPTEYAFIKAEQKRLKRKR